MSLSSSLVWSVPVDKSLISIGSTDKAFRSSVNGSLRNPIFEIPVIMDLNVAWQHWALDEPKGEVSARDGTR
jgi:hypothetical protein